MCFQKEHQTAGSFSIWNFLLTLTALRVPKGSVHTHQGVLDVLYLSNWLCSQWLRQGIWC